MSNLRPWENTIQGIEIKLILGSRAKFIFLDEPFNGVAPKLLEQTKAEI